VKLIFPCTGLPPAFRFHPTDEELILHYLCNRATIPEVDIYNMEPWDLPARAKFGDCEWYLSCFPKKEWHIFCHRKYPISSGYWMATGKARRLTLSGAAGKMLGSKRRLVFHLPSGKMTGWVMHEYHLPDNTTLRSIISSTTASSSTSSTRVRNRVHLIIIHSLCKHACIYQIILLLLHA
jgi:hypothetical protein